MDSIETSSKADFIPSVFKISALIRLSLWSLYIALLLPLPFLATTANLKVSLAGLGIALVVGGVLLNMVLSEEVQVDAAGITVRYPWWVPQWLRQGWSLKWADIEDFQSRSTGQGGLVYYLVSKNRDGYLLPTRIDGFSQMLRLIESNTHIDTRDVKPLAQPWMYLMLLIAAGLLAIADIWIIWMALSHPGRG
ncbi:MAG: hypothetical protein HC852_03815 [Acaryochloridaceae cyanobacterium RU_4_10]|nr:hypothetical protein [Acaryochloridaceae cyanobacterium RU_4_10]